MSKLNLSLVVNQQWQTIKQVLSELNVDFNDEMQASLLSNALTDNNMPVTGPALFHFMDLIIPKLSHKQFNTLSIRAAQKNALNAIKMMDFSECNTVEQALNSYCIQSTLVMTDTRLKIEEFVGETWLKCFRTYSNQPWFTFSECYGINVYKELVIQFSGINWKPSKLSLLSSDTKHLNFNNFLPSTAVFIERDFYGFQIDKETLALPLNLKPYFSTDSIFKDIQDNFIQALRYVVLSQLGESVITLELVSKITQLSPRTVQRRLQGVGTNFQQFYEELIVEEAKRRLTHHSNSVTDICYQLGYSSPPSFIRFFKQRVGMTPKKFQLLYKS